MLPCSPTMWNYTAQCPGLICTLQLSLYWWQCNIKTSLHTMCALVTPLEEGIFGVGHIAGLEPNTSVLPVSREKLRIFLKSSESVHQPAGQSSKMAPRSKSFCGPDDSLPLADILVLCGSYPLMLQKGVGQKICHVSNCCQRLKHRTYDSSLRWF